MPTLLSDNLWAKLSTRFRKHKRIRAAIAYVTASHLSFGRNDLLVCDASDAAIKGGLTSAKMLRNFFTAGAEIYSYPGLHSKVAVIDDEAIVGSANLSENAGTGTCEATLLTDDRQVVGLLSGFVEKVKDAAEEIDEAFLCRIESIPVIRTGGISRRSKKPIAVGESRVWLVGSKPLSDRILEAEAEEEEEGIAEAEKNLTDSGYEVRTLRWTGKTRFRTEAKAGDLVIEIFTEKRGTRRFSEVYKAAPILLRQDEKGWTRFHLEVPVDGDAYFWRIIKAELARLGLAMLSHNCTRELTGKQVQILQFME